MKEKIWLWGQTPGSHHKNEGYRLPGVNNMTPSEGAEYFGIKNMCRVKMSVDSGLSFENEISRLINMDKIVLSIIGAGGCKFYRDGKNDLDELITLAKDNPKIVAGIMDDFVSPVRMELYTPDVLKEMRLRLHTDIERKIEFWSVVYERDFRLAIADRVSEFDLITYWTWYGDKLTNLEGNYKTIREIAQDKPVMMGVYLWDYGNKRELPDDLMRYQLSFVEEKMRTGEIEGIILCSNCTADLGLSTTKITKDWIDNLD